MSHQRIICKSEDLLEKGKGVRFELPELGERVTAFAVRFNGVAYLISINARICPWS
ncbi:protein of unknown function [Candidatus Methylopumilus turicensis]|uniref:Uncharacterized protein n=1 Tax=Candidatus Methylopumilus turicensis TaxID=1581680 RepID=A0A0B7IUH1_9PROT|nr:protein of unknown function [Candidatus Methylopumilus turicensis]